MKHPVRPSAGFTLIEMIVAVALLVLIIVGVARVFQDASRAVSLSQNTLEMLSNVRAAQTQIESDLSRIDRNGFLVIRSTQDPKDPSRRFDQISFIALGHFPNRTGTMDQNNPLADSTTANAAFVHYGHGIVERTNANQNSPMSNFKALPTDADSSIKDQHLVLCRNAVLLMAKNGGTLTSLNNYEGMGIAAYQGIAWDTSPILAGAGEVSRPASISSSRIAVASVTAANVMQTLMLRIALMNGRAANANAARWEANYLCYRFRVLPDPYSTEITDNSGRLSLMNGYFRTHPVLLQGASSFKVQWTDGSCYRSGDRVYSDGKVQSGETINLGDARINCLKWYGLDDDQRYLFAFPRSGDNNASEPSGGNTIAQKVAEPSLNNSATGDLYTAIFSYDNRALWPKALKITYRVTDRANQLAGGREFTQIVRLPD